MYSASIQPTPETAAAAAAADPVFASIETHKAAWIERAAVASATAKARFLSKGEERRKVARDLYDARTNMLVRSPITTMAGLQAFTAYIASLRAYGSWQSYAVEVWHLSDAMESIAEVLTRLGRPNVDPTSTAH